MSANLILVHTTSGCHVLFVNQEVVMEAMSTEEIDRLVETAARKLSTALGVPLVECTVEANPDGNWVAADLYALIPRDITMQLGTTSEVAVRHWDTYYWDEKGRIQRDPNTHKFEIDDKRSDNGQARLILTALDESRGEDLIDVLLEVHSHPLESSGNVVCAHVHVDGDDPVVSLYRIGDRILVIPNTGVTLKSDTVEIDDREQSVVWIS